MKKLFLLILTFALLLTNVAFGYTDTFEFEREADDLHQLGVFDGKNSLTFDPALGDYLTRQESMKILSDLFSWEINQTYLSHFTDVSSWASPYVYVAFERSVTNGIGNNLFGGKQNVTYAEFYTWILRELGEKDPYSSNKSTWTNNLESTCNKLGIYYDRRYNMFGDISRDYAVGVAHSVLGQTSKDANQSVYMTIISNDPDIKQPSHLKNTLYISPDFGFRLSYPFERDNSTQVTVSKSDLFTVTFSDPDRGINSITAAVCGKNLCMTMSTKILSYDNGVYQIQLVNELEAGVPYYISNFVINYSDTTSETIQVTKEEFLVVNDFTDPNTPLTVIETKTELDNYVNYYKGPLVIDFYANWCGPCVSLDPVYRSVSSNVAGEILMLKVDVDVIGTAGFEVNSIPNQHFYNSGKLVGIRIGYGGEDSNAYEIIVRSYFD